MAAVYSKRLLIGGSITSTVSAVVPAGYVWVLKGIDGTSHAGAAGDALLVAIATLGLVTAFRVNAVQVWASSHWTGMAVLTAGETLQAIPLQGTWDVQVSGYQLSAAA